MSEPEQYRRALAAADALAERVVGDHHDHICQVRREHDLDCGLEARCRCGWWQVERALEEYRRARAEVPT